MEKLIEWLRWKWFGIRFSRVVLTIKHPVSTIKYRINH